MARRLARRPCEDRTALPDDIVASMGAGVALQARSYTAALRAEWAAGAGAHAQRAAAAVPTFTLRAEVPGAGAASDAPASCPVPGELEDRACGWRRVVTAEHKDKVNYGPLKEFWHEEGLVSTVDNQNKVLVSRPCARRAGSRAGCCRACAQDRGTVGALSPVCRGVSHTQMPRGPGALAGLFCSPGRPSRTGAVLRADAGPWCRNGARCFLSASVRLSRPAYRPAMGARARRPAAARALDRWAAAACRHRHG